MKLKISFLLVLTSFFLHLYLMNTHYEFRYGFEGQKSLCSISDKLNCESVSISPYSYFAGLPLATWGMSFHLSFLFLFGLLLTQPNRRDSILRFIKFFSVLSVIATLAMGIVSFMMMETYCIFCITLYVLSFINIIVLSQVKNVSFLPNLDDLGSLRKGGDTGLIYILVSLVTIPVIAFLAHDMSSRTFKEKSAYMIADALSEWEREPKREFANPTLVKGSENPTFTIVEFADFQCIHCKNASHNLQSFVSSRPGVQLQFYSFPLDNGCNPAVGSGGNGKSCILAKAAYCAEKQQKGWEAHNWMFDHFGTDQNTDFEALAKDLDLDYQTLNTCIQSEAAMTFVTSSAKLGQEAGVDGTPAIFVNGKRLPAGHVIAVLEALYKKLHTD